jgi:hypothetical protein
MHLRRHAAVLSAATLLATTALVGAASSASAVTCSVGREGADNRTAWGYCSEGYARYSVLIYVTHPNPNSGIGSWYEAGNCVTTGQRSLHTPSHSYPFSVVSVNPYC